MNRTETKASLKTVGCRVQEEEETNMFRGSRSRFSSEIQVERPRHLSVGSEALGNDLMSGKTLVYEKN